MSNYLVHYGTPRHSGRYPWGSGKEPYQSLVRNKSGGTLTMKIAANRDPAKTYAKAVIKKEKINNKLNKRYNKYSKAVIKTGRRKSKKYIKYKNKEDKYNYKAEKKRHGLFANPEKADKYQAKADKYKIKADKYAVSYNKAQAKKEQAYADYMKSVYKYNKLVKSMDKVFSEMDTNQLSKDAINSGKRYGKTLENIMLHDQDATDIKLIKA